MADFYIAAGKVYELEKCLVHMRVKNLNIQKVFVIQLYFIEFLNMFIVPIIKFPNN